ncbi:hypothetical protein ANN_27122 [Periplaneta americana]|uniref:Uncharacterized protein n=1 Tax=Periplaneta americana TaxID=6978 RepID=A0ABQ8RX96_PERAM|nr:hypothetical protein ANN_27122 [Periplaneta americana]
MTNNGGRLGDCATLVYPRTLPEAAVQNDLAELCRKCNNSSTNDGGSVECEGCENREHRKCAGLTQGEFDTLNRTNCRLIWLCEERKPRLKKIGSYEDRLHSIAKSMDETQEQIKIHLETILVGKIQEAVAKEMEKITGLVVLTKNDAQEREGVQGEQQSQPQRKKSSEQTNNQAQEVPRVPPIRGVKQQREQRKAAVVTSPSIANQRNAPDQAACTRPVSAPHNTATEDMKSQHRGERKEKCQPAISREDEENAENESRVTGAHTHVDGGTPYSTVVKKKAKIQGTKPPSVCTLKPAEHKMWLYVGKLHPETSSEDLTCFIKANEIREEIECEQLETKGKNRAFRVGIPLKYNDKINAPEAWPEGVLVRRYIFRRQRYGQVRLPSARLGEESRQLREQNEAHDRNSSGVDKE